MIVSHHDNPTETALAEARADCHLLSHPFNRRYEAGVLSRGELIQYAEKHRYFEATFPMFLDNLSARLSDGLVRDSEVAKLSDDVSSPSHLNHFERFARSFGATDTTISPTMLYLVGSYSVLLKQGPEQSLAGP